MNSKITRWGSLRSYRNWLLTGLFCALYVLYPAAEAAAQVPNNNECSGAIALTPPGATCTNTSGTTVGATLSMAAAPCNGNPDDDVWYSFVATATDVKVDLSNVVAVVGGSTDMYFQVLSGACGTTQTSLLCSDPNSGMVGGLTVGQTYYIRVYTYGAAVTATFDICVTNLAAAPTSCATLSAPANNSQASMLPTLSWSSVTNATAYDIYLGSATPPTTLYATVYGNATTSYTPTVALAPGDYYWYVVPKNSVGAPTTCATNVRKFTVIAPPANNECANAVVLTQTATCTNTAGTTVAATQSMAAAPCSGNPDDDVWFSFVATATDAKIDLSSVVAVIGTSTDMYFQVLSGACGGTQTSLLCSDPNSAIVGGLTVGQTYYIRVYTYAVSSGATFNICVTNLAAAPTTCATLSAPANNGLTAALATVTWSTVTNATSYDIYLGSTNPPTTLHGTVYGNATTSYTVPTPLPLGDYYWYVVPRNSVGAPTTCASNTRKFTVVGPPANDDCGGAATLTVNPDYNCGATTTGTTVAATQSNETAPTVNPTGTNDDVWYSFTATNTAHRITLSNVTGTVTDMAMAIYSGSCGSLVHIQSSDPDQMDVTGLTPGQIYKVRVYTYTATAGSTASFTICVGTQPPPPANDNCSGAVALTQSATCTNTAGTTGWATQSMAAAPCAGNPDDDVWYSFVATATDAKIDLSSVVAVIGTSTDMYFQVLSGACGGTQTSLLCSDPNSGIVGGLTVGQTYYIRVYTYGAAYGANFNICVTNLATAPTTCATLSAPANNSQASTFPTLTWNTVTNATAYDIYLGSANPPTTVYATVFGNATTSYTPTVALPPGDYYWYVVPKNSVGAPTTCATNVRKFTTVGPPANDSCNNAVVLTQNLTCTNTAGTTVGATLSMAAAPCNGNPDDDVWFSFMATGVDAKIDLSSVVAVVGTSTDMYFQVLSGTCGSTQTSLLCNDPNSGTVTGLTPGQIYYIRVYTYGANNGATFNICVTNVTAPVTCAQPNSITIPAGTLTSNSAVINWNPALIGPPTGYEWEVRSSGAAGSGATGLAASGTTTGTTASTGPVLSVATNYTVYVRTNCGSGNFSVWSSASFTTVCIPPVVTGTTPGSRCGTGTVTLGATADAGTLNWYAAASGGSPLGTGNTFTTPSISATTNYYVQSSYGSGVTLGPVSPTAQGGVQGTQTTGWDVNFTVSQNTTLTSVDIFPITSGESGVIRVQTGTGFGGTILATINYTTSVSGGATAQTIPINYAIAPGSYSLYTSTLPASGLKRNTSGAVYPYTSSVANITGNGFDNTYFMGMYNWQFGSSCVSQRVMVAATVAATPDTAVTVSGSTTICQGKTVTFNAATGTGISYQWLLNNNIIAGATNASYAANAAGNYRVRVSNGICADTSGARTVTVIPIPVSAVTAGGPTTICSGRNVVLSGPAPVSGVTYQWQLNAANISGATAQTYTATAAGAYRLILANGACADTSAGVTVTVNPSPTATITAAGPVNFCTGGSVVLNANTGTGFTYKWQRNNTDIGGATAAAYTVTTSGNYRVIVTGGTCSDTSAATTVTVNPAPAATITPAGPTTFCQGGSVVLNANTGTGLTYQWKNGGTDITGATASSYTATTAGSYTVVVTQGCGTTSAPVTVIVNPLPVATATAAGPLAFCQGGSVVLNANTGTGLGYQWLRNNAAIAGANAATYTATLSGNYRVRVTNTTTGCADTSAAPGIAVDVTVPASATVTQVGTSPVCQGNVIRFLAAAGANYTYQWYKDGQPIAGATNVSYIANASGAYHVVITNGACTTTTTDRTIVVNPLPTATATAAGPVNFCVGGSVVINAATAAGQSYQWSVNSGAIPGATNSAVTATQSGIYTVTVTNISTGCQATSAGVTVNVSTLPVPVITPLGPTTFCQGNSVVLASNTDPAYTYQWYNNGTAIAGETGATYTASASGSYTVEITNGTCVAMSATAITVTITPAPPAVITAQGPVTFCQGNSVTLETAAGSGFTYQWTLNGTNIPGATTSRVVAGASGSYNVNVFDGTCPTTAAPVVVTVGTFPVAVITVTGGVNMSADAFAAYQWYRNGVAIPGANARTYTAIRDGFYTVVVTDALGCSATSPVQHITALEIGGVNPAAKVVSVWPNPTDGILHIETSLTAVDATILSIDGKEVMKAENTKTVDATQLSQGLYLIRISDHKSGQLITIQKFNKR